MHFVRLYGWCELMAVCHEKTGHLHYIVNWKSQVFCTVRCLFMIISTFTYEEILGFRSLNSNTELRTF